MGNNPSTTSKPATPTSATTPSQSTPGSGHESPRHHRKDVRNIIPVHRSPAPPEPSLAQAQGSTVINRPKSLPSTAVSSLSGSPLGNVSSPSRHADSRPRDVPSKPVDVPVESSSLRSHHSAHASASASVAASAQAAAAAANASVNLPIEAADLIATPSITDMYSRPPRLPLPIDEEVHTPGSPILAADENGDIPGDIDLGDSSDGMGRKGSTLSANTVDEEEGEELRVDKTRPTVPTRLEWVQGGEKIYVTGTIFQWNRKQRLHPVEGKPGCYAAIIHVLPGTHHVRFLVDGIMQTSPDLPTTVDFGNNLVNYIEVSSDDAAHAQAQKPQELQQALPEGVAPAAAKAQDEDVAAAAFATASSQAQTAPAEEQPVSQAPKGKDVASLDKYRCQIPQYLVDFDQPEDSPAYQYALTAIEKLPNPPGLPGFLSKPILNAATLMKDDNSVLNMPNHTVLNHLATSSIKNNILAVSATTRYRNKYVTTIIYKPTNEDG